MLTAKQNLLETIRGGTPDRYVKQFEFVEVIMECPLPPLPVMPGTAEGKDGWGITWNWSHDQPGAMPLHGPGLTVLTDINNWREQVHPPEVDLPDEMWAPAVTHTASVNREEQFVSPFFWGGLFEMCHHLMGVEAALTAFYEAPERMHELIAFLTDHELRMADQIIDHLHPDLLFHHDDWGSQNSTLLSPELFRTFFVEPYKKIYSYWKKRGVELVVHHSDSYGETLVPDMVDMGIDIWQGVMSTNNTPELIRKFGSKITFMGEIDSGPVDTVNWTQKQIMEHVEKACEKCGTHYFIPCLTQGGHFSTVPEVYGAVSDAIDTMTQKMFPTVATV